MSELLLHYNVHDGNGPYLLLTHGILSSRAQWLANIEALSRFSRPVTVELLGHARSPSPEDPAAYTPASYVRQFEALREKLGAQRWLVCGQSLGAALTLRYVIEHPERVISHVFTNSMSALAVPAWRDAVMPAMRAQAERLERDGMKAIEEHPLNPARAKRLPAAVKEALVEDVALHTPRGIALTGLHTVPDSSVRDQVARNVVPSLLVVGERETRFLEYRDFARENLPHLEVVGFNAGHAVNAEVSEQFNAAVERFFVPYLS